MSDAGLKYTAFFWMPAGDGAVPPLLPTSQRLGDERVRALQAGVMGSGPLCDAYRERRLLESHLETAAAEKWAFPPGGTGPAVPASAARPLYPPGAGGFFRLSAPPLALALQRLTSKGLLESDPPVICARKPVLTPEAGSVIADLEASQEDALADRLAGFTPEERKEYLAFSQRITENLQRCLQS